MQAQARMLDPFELGPYGRHLTVGDVPTSDGWVAATALIDPRRLRRLLRTHAARLGVDETDVAGSAWAKHYLSTAVPGILAALTLHGIGLDARPGNVLLQLEEGTPVAVHLRDPCGHPDAPGRDLTLRTLFGDHLTPLFDALYRASGVKARILWGSAGNLCAYLYDRFSEEAPQTASVPRDRDALLRAARAAWAPVPNPLRDPVRYERFTASDLPARVQVRRTCCLRYRIPHAAACYTCPLISRTERETLLRARRTS